MVVLLVCVLSGGGCRAGRPRPNVLIVTIDTLRADRLGCYGFGLARTPAIDRLAREGVRCTDAASVAPITMPSHTSILTGLYPPAHGVRDNGAYALSDQVTTLAERLQAAGYETSAFVSAAVLARQYNLNQGFDTYDDDLSAEDAPALFMVRDRPAPRTAARVLAWLGRWLAESSRRPFFAWVHFYDPHQPYDAHGVDDYLSPSPYDQEIAAADRGVGAILDRLRTANVLDDTLVVLTADHGESLDEHGEKTHGLFIYDATQHVPLIWRYPRQLPAAATYADPVRAVDIVPTILTLLGLPGARETQGVSLLAALQGTERLPDLPQYAESLLAEVGFGMAPLQGIRQHGTKYIRAPRPELYDLHADPRELANRYTDADPRAQALAATLDTVLADSAQRAAPVQPSAIDHETAEMLRALGYLAPASDRASMGGIDPKDGLAIYEQLERARHRGQANDWAGARDLLVDIVTRLPRHVTALNILAVAYLQLNDPDAAERTYHASLAVEPRQHRIALQLALIALRRDDLDGAERHLRAALAFAPSFSQAMAWLGYVQTARGDAPGAEQWWTRGSALDPQFALALRPVADAYFERKDYRRARALYERVLALAPTHFAALVQAGNVAQQTDDIPGAITYLQRAQEARPDSWIPPYNLACLYATTGQPAAALDQLRRALDAGFARPQLLATNDDFIALREQPEFAAVMAAAQARAGQRPGAGPAN